jgi:hypothetical protein
VLLRRTLDPRGREAGRGTGDTGRAGADHLPGVARSTLVIMRAAAAGSLTGAMRSVR